VGFWVPARGLGFYADGVVPCPPNLQLNEKTGSIFCLKAHAVLSAVSWVGTLSRRPRQLLIYTGGINTVDMVNSMRAEHGYNTVMVEAVDTLIDIGLPLRVFHISSEEN
jgi:hypothetical protein